MNQGEEYSGIQLFQSFYNSENSQHREWLGKATLVVSDADFKGPT